MSDHLHLKPVSQRRFELLPGKNKSSCISALAASEKHRFFNHSASYSLVCSSGHVIDILKNKKKGHFRKKNNHHVDQTNKQQPPQKTQLKTPTLEITNIAIFQSVISAQASLQCNCKQLMKSQSEHHPSSDTIYRWLFSHKHMT